MEPYWKKMYPIDNETHSVELYHYSESYIGIISTHYFLNGFRAFFEKIGGVYNKKLKTLNKAGFLIKLENQDKLIDIIKNIFNKTIKINDNSQIINDAITIFTKLNKLILDNKEQIYTIKDDNDTITQLSFNNDNENDDLIISYKSSKGEINLYQRSL